MKDYKDYIQNASSHLSSSIRLGRRRGVYWKVFLFFILIIPLFLFQWRGEKEEFHPPEGEPLEEKPTPPTEKKIQVIEGTLNRGRTLGGLLVEKEVSRDLSIALLASLGKVLDLRRCQAGDQFTLEITEEGNLVRFEYHSGPKRQYIIEPDGEDLRSFQKAIEVARKLARFEGMIERSLYDAFLRLEWLPREEIPYEKRADLAYAFADIFSWDLDFHLDVKKGDRFRGIVYKEYIDGEFIGFGPILIAQYDPAPPEGEGHTAIYFEESEDHSDYYYPNGKSLRKVFLRSALQYRRISSKYSTNRYHPILKIYRPHHGVDYAAPRGTPVSAIGDGTIVYAGRKGQYGKLIQIRHPNGYQSGYGHLSRYAKGMKKGKKVKQGQIIGYVGSTGLSTGPHLHFEMTRNGRYINPLKVNIPAADPVKEGYRPQFERWRDELLALLDGYDTLKRIQSFAQLTHMAKGGD